MRAWAGYFFGPDRTDVAAFQATSGKSAERVQTAASKPRNIRAGMRSNFQPVGAVDCRAAEWRTADAGDFRRTRLPVRKSQVCRQVPAAESSQWFNYGGDKLWLLPEGNNDEQHWVGDSDVLDDGPFPFESFRKDSCGIELTGPVDPQTGIQFTPGYVWTPIPRGSGFTRR